MFEYSPSADHHRRGPLEVQSAVFDAWVEYLAADSGPTSGHTPEGSVSEIVSDAELIDQLRALEELKGAAAAAQARISAAFDASQRRKQEHAGLRKEDLGRGVASQIALARRESANKGGRLLGLAKVLTAEMPYTMRALSLGKISEWRATLLVRETACLSLQDRRLVDEEVAGDTGLLESLGDRQIIARAKAAAYRLDPRGAVNRAAKAASERFVSCRPAPDTMTYLTGLLPVAQGVGVYAALSREADRLRAAGDARGRGQIMADTLVERVTGQGDAGSLKVEIQLVMTDRTLLAGDSEPVLVPGYGPVPAQWARDLVRRRSSLARSRRGRSNRGRAKDQAVGGPDKHEERWIRRLYAAPDTGELVAMDSRARLFPKSLARFIAARDTTCRMPWCGAPIRHLDHIRPHNRGGPTNAANGQGLCEACNHAKEAPGWTAEPVRISSPVPAADAGINTGTRDTADTAGTAGTAPAGHTVNTTTPTGHTYRSTAPPLPGTAPRGTMPQPAHRPFHPELPLARSPERSLHSPVEACIADFVWAA
ncbi:HNH endonuclease signature motif containing protein [Arthrobacter sp. zg-Y1171]|uniref:HNH endonuclease n=1 Tax=Arthrobacter sp. zg-Y1171 TaxID=2964610 RepID=UPI002106798D|nr:HNH endonuclease signature motif containing protein [Arthrobacter sp. zg-Y1171]MCQ1995401.1 HNH endonuclease [Arthrobacter sp. zg-Y1171]UWX80563.1 HNH endonuclease [Arthrobacter sp. zg-Y1171]